MTTDHTPAPVPTPAAAPNHHAHSPGFTGPTGYLLAATMIMGRTSDARLAERLSTLGPGDTVVDVGSGPGAAVRHAARRGASAIGVDPAKAMRRVARILTRPSLSVRYLPGSAEAIPLPDNSASILWSIAAVHHWNDLDAALQEARRVLHPAGRLVAIERHTQPGAQGHASHGWTDDQATAFAQHCANHGFLNTQVHQHQDGRRRTLSVTAIAP